MESETRKHGPGPPRVVVVHGGPGGAGEVAPLAQALGAAGYGVLEPFQGRRSIAALIEELRAQVVTQADTPVALIGWSWGAWLAGLLAARETGLVRRLILVGCPPLEARFATRIRATKDARLTAAERAAWATLRPTQAKPADAAAFLALSDASDTFARDASPAPELHLDPAIHRAVWAEAAALRASGALLDTFAGIRCPVDAFHGDYDPHPIAGVALPLRAALPSARVRRLARCGHKPWQERHARAVFFAELSSCLGPV